MRLISILVLFLMGLAPSALAAQQNSSISDQVASLKEQVESLKISVQELQVQNEDAKSSFKSAEQKLIEAKGLAPDTKFTQSMDERAQSLEEKRGPIKIWGSLTAIVQSSVNQRIHPGIQANTVYVDPVTGAVLKNNFGQIHEDQTIGAGDYDIYLESQILDNTKVFVDLEDGSANQVINPIMSQPNSNATFSTHITPQNLDVLNVLELYVESEWYEKRLTTTIGKIYLSDYFDLNTVAHDDKSQFLGYAFYNNMTFASVEPYYTIGARASLDIGWGLTAQVAATSQEDSGAKLFNALFGIVELDYKTSFFFGKEGNYRAYGYVDDIDNVDSTAQHAGVTGTSSNALGAGISADQKVTDKLTVFSRLGWNEAKLASTISTLDGTFPAVSSSLSFGGQYEGLLPNRPDDVLGGAWALTNPSDPFGTFPERPDNEYFMEFYYNYKVKDNFHVSPLLQFVEHPNGDDDKNWITIFGGRVALDF